MTKELLGLLQLYVLLHSTEETKPHGFGSKLISYSRTAKQKESVATHQRNKHGFFSSFVRVVNSHLLLLPLYLVRLVTVLDPSCIKPPSMYHGVLAFNIGRSM
jgi:hypothetical protein